MKEFKYITMVSDIDYCGMPHIAPLTYNDIPCLPDEYFDEETSLTKVPSYVWKNKDNEIKAFVLNTESFFKDIGLGVRIVGYQTIVKDISFFTEILPYVKKHLKRYNDETGHPYDYLFFQNDDLASFSKPIVYKIESLGFVYNSEHHAYLLTLKENTPE